MAYVCELCHKRPQAGRQHTHHPGVAGGQWKKRAPKTIRRFKPNLHWVSLPIDGVVKRVRACTTCIKRVRYDTNKLKSNSLQKQHQNSRPIPRYEW